MKTALESLDALEALARKIASVRDGTTGPVYSDRDGIAAEWEADAVAIVSELPEPVDPLVAQAQRYYDDWVADPSDMPFAVDAMAYALRRAREEGVR